MAYVYDPELEAKVAREMRRERRSLPLAYLLCLFAGGVGVHRFYLGYNTTGTFQAALVVTGLPLSIYGIGLPMLVAWFFWQIFDLFYIPTMARNYLEGRKVYVARRLGVNHAFMT